jgi:hypothetical protein
VRDGAGELAKPVVEPSAKILTLIVAERNADHRDRHGHEYERVARLDLEEQARDLRAERAVRRA